MNDCVSVSPCRQFPETQQYPYSSLTIGTQQTHSAMSILTQKNLRYITRHIYKKYPDRMSILLFARVK